MSSLYLGALGGSIIVIFLLGGLGVLGGSILVPVSLGVSAVRFLLLFFLCVLRVLGGSALIFILPWRSWRLGG